MSSQLLCTNRQLTLSPWRLAKCQFRTPSPLLVLSKWVSFLWHDRHKHRRSSGSSTSALARLTILVFQFYYVVMDDGCRKRRQLLSFYIMALFDWEPIVVVTFSPIYVFFHLLAFTLLIPGKCNIFVINGKHFQEKIINCSWAARFHLWVYSFLGGWELVSQFIYNKNMCTYT